MENATLKVFLVDDDKLFVTMLADHLEEQGRFAVTTFATGEDFLEHIGENPDIVILDYYLDSAVPGAKNGLEILDQIKKTAPGLRVIMLSSQEKYGVALQTIAHGAVHYVIKDLHSFLEIDNILSDL